MTEWEAGGHGENEILIDSKTLVNWFCYKIIRACYSPGDIGSSLSLMVGCSKVTKSHVV